MPGVAWAILAGISFGISQLAFRSFSRSVDAISATTIMVSAMLVSLTVATTLSGDLAELSSIPLASVGWFVAAALVHFLLGWTLFAVSQQEMGTSRAAAVVAINPGVAAVLAAIIINQQLRAITWIGLAAVIVGVVVVAGAGSTTGTRTARGMATSLAATLMFSVSPLLVTFGLDGFDRPLLGLTIGIAVTAPSLHLTARIMNGKRVRLPQDSRRWVVLAAFASGFAVAAQWIAFDLIPVGSVVSLQMVATPVVLFLGPTILKEPFERPDRILIGGAGLIILGVVLVATFGRVTA